MKPKSKHRHTYEVTFTITSEKPLEVAALVEVGMNYMRSLDNREWKPSDIHVKEVSHE